MTRVELIKGIEIYDPYTDSFVKHDSDAFITLVAKSVIDERNRWLDVLDKIRAEIEQMPSELTADGRRMIRRESVFRIIDEHKEKGV